MVSGRTFFQVIQGCRAGFEPRTSHNSCSASSLKLPLSHPCTPSVQGYLDSSHRRTINSSPGLYSRNTTFRPSSEPQPLFEPGFYSDKYSNKPCYKRMYVHTYIYTYIQMLSNYIPSTVQHSVYHVYVMICTVYVHIIYSPKIFQYSTSPRSLVQHSLKVCM